MKNFLNKNKTVVITVVVILILLMLFYVFKDDIKALFSKNEPVEDLTQPSNTGSNTGSATGTNTNTTTVTTSVIGKSAYANQNGVAVLNKNDGATLNTKNKDQFIGVIKGNATLGGSPFYTLGTGLMVVSKNKVYIK